jgi:hypothetical protein
MGRPQRPPAAQRCVSITTVCTRHVDLLEKWPGFSASSEAYGRFKKHLTKWWGIRSGAWEAAVRNFMDVPRLDLAIGTGAARRPKAQWDFSRS